VTAGKDELMKEVGSDVLGPEMSGVHRVRSRAHPRPSERHDRDRLDRANAVTADGQHRFYSYDIDEAVRALAHLPSGFQEPGRVGAGFDPRAMHPARNRLAG
jgi:hypothetical protein